MQDMNIWYGIGLMIAFFLGMVVSNILQYWFSRMQSMVRKQVEEDKGSKV